MMIERQYLDHWEIWKGDPDDKDAALVVTFEGPQTVEAHAAFRALQNSAGIQRFTLLRKYAMTWIDGDE